MQINTAVVQQRKVDFFRLAVVCLVLVCLLSVFSSTVFAQTTYVITDGENTTVYTSSPLTNPEQILSDAGHALGDGDLYITQETEDGTTEIVVQRLQYITVNNCGQVQEEQTYGETVEQLLTRIGVPVYGDGYVFSAQLTDETFDGMTIQVDHILDQEQTYSVELPFNVCYGYDDTLAEGQEVVIANGQRGQALRTDAVQYKNGSEVSRTMLEETVQMQPTTQYVLKGTGLNVGATRTKPLIGDGFIITPEGQVLTFSHSEQYQATAYTQTDEGCNDTTATGTKVHKGVVAVDPRKIPYFTKMYIVSNDGAYVYGISRAEDCGGAIKGNRVDLYFDTTAECFQFGRRNCTIYFLN